MTATYVVEPTRQTPVVLSADVVVVGGGPAGLAAAVAAARLRARVCLIERYGYLGGLATGGLVITIPKEASIHGLARELYSQLAAMGAAVDNATNNWRPGRDIVIDAEAMKCLADDWLERNGVMPLYHSLAVGISMANQRILAVLVENKSGRQAVSGRIFVDATGDGDLSAWAGAPWEMGNSEGRTRKIGMMYNLVNVDMKRWLDYCSREGVKQRYYFTAVHEGEVNCWGGGGVTENEGAEISTADYGAQSGISVTDLTRREMELRRCIWRDYTQLRRLPGFERSFISQLASQIGVRETRRIVGEVLLNDVAWRNQEVSPDSIGLAYGRTIPYGCIVPKRVDNLLVAGRCISTSHFVQGFTRQIPCCMTTGQAAGIAAVLALQTNALPREVDVRSVQRELTRQGVDLGL